MIEPAKAVLSPARDILSDAWSAVLGDRIAAWRLRNAAAIQTRVISEIERMGLRLDRTRIPERYAVTWFEEATKQDEPEIQTLFARLLARAAVGDADAADRRLVDIVGRLTPLDARVMEWLFERAGPPPRHPQMGEWEAWSAARKEFGEDAGLSIEHLVLVGILERQYSLSNDGGLRSWQTIEEGHRLNELAKEITGDLSIVPELSATSLGMALHSACFADVSAEEADRRAR